MVIFKPLKIIHILKFILTTISLGSLHLQMPKNGFLKNLMTELYCTELESLNKQGFPHSALLNIVHYQVHPQWPSQ